MITLESEENDRILWVDWAKALATLAIVLIHVSAVYTVSTPAFSSDWYSFVNFNTFDRFGIMLFLFASGFLILRKPEPITNLTKRFKRLLPPFLFWFTVYALVAWSLFHSEESISWFFPFYLRGLLDPTGFFSTFWFVYLILGLYLIAPVLSKWIQGAKVYELEYFLVICFIFWAISFISEITSFPITFTSYFQYFGQGIGSFVLGYYIAIKNSRYTKSKKFGFKLYIVGVLFTYLGAIIIAEMTGKPSTLTNLSPTIAIQTVGLFIILKNINFEKSPKVLNSMAISLSNNSYEFYLIQIPIIWTVTILLRPWNVDPLVKILVMFLATVLIITLLLKVLKKVPYLNTIVWSR